MDKRNIKNRRIDHIRKDFKQIVITPLPVLMIGTYDEDGVADVMNAAWGGQCGPNHVELNLAESHKTVENIKLNKEFTVSFATKDTLVISDYFGIASANDTDKISQSGVSVIKAENVNAPIVEEYPLTLECKLVSIDEVLGEQKIIGEVVNVTADESILDDEGNIDLGKADIISYDSVSKSYRVLGDIVGSAFSDGKKLIK